MRVLIIGGTGMIGINTALHLQSQGHEVHLAARTATAPEHPAAQFPVLTGDFTTGDFSRDDLTPFEAIVFAAGNDPRHMPADADAEAFYRKTQSDGVPAFASLARDAGVERFVQVGSYYHHLRPDLAEHSTYIRARQLADDRTRALSRDGFCAITLNPPSIVGAVPGLPAARYRMLADWGRGLHPDIPSAAPPGGTNYMSVRSLAEAIASALEQGEAGKAYLIGDKNLSYRAFFQMFFDVAGSRVEVETQDREHPLLPDPFIIQGRGNTLAYEPDAGLSYTRNDVRRAVAEVVAMSGAAAEETV
ncbi:NAD-dependent epimerase/dehydratase family protein [Thalassorhabdomicrobium marinisediminis]|uniref:Nucleoside-diphosphate sugar epimerase n=1 Tax=Thalassorhabdomicrobium marinisediminis TaxID=2170577 RepID=A0A2T7FUA7_9RHOB|nr:NAD-dependent epimerase/dehydratase family protein [Thalassorhabdomicrobium marinisediminis]PVA05743.1 nucleoside-diphosphate sugar epimerase [Thalassorhabdomicrobium marinisediminis]